MPSIARTPVVLSMMLIIATWAVPVCCLAMSDGHPTPMTVHHHHHPPMTNDSPSAPGLAADAARSCDARLNPAVISLPARDGFSLLQHASVLAAAQADAVTTSQRSLVRSSADPPTIHLRLAFQAVPLRI